MTIIMCQVQRQQQNCTQDRGRLKSCVCDPTVRQSCQSLVITTVLARDIRMFTAMEQMKVKMDKLQKTVDAMRNMLEGLCSGAGSVTTEDTESLPEQVRLPLKTSEELNDQEGPLDDKNIFAASLT